MEVVSLICFSRTPTFLLIPFRTKKLVLRPDTAASSVSDNIREGLTRQLGVVQTCVISGEKDPCGFKFDGQSGLFL